MSGTAAKPIPTQPAPTGAVSSFISLLGGSMGTSPMYNPTTTNTTYLTQTSQPDITSLVNSTMQQLLGRNATPDEIANYGSQLLAAERANTGNYSGQTTYAMSNGSKQRNTVTGTQTTTGIDPSAYLATLINGTASAGEYRAATQYFQGMQQVLTSMKGPYNG